MGRTKNNLQPYIGMTGITISEEAKIAARIADQCNKRATAPHMTEIGVLVNDDTLHGETYNRRYPPLDTVPKIFAAALNANYEMFNVVHYTCRAPEQLAQSVHRILDLPGMYHDGEESALCQALQLNGGFSRVYSNQLKQIKDEYPAISIIYQVPSRDLLFSPEDIVLQLKDKIEFIDYVLLDPSGGRGELMDFRTVVPCAKALFIAFGMPVVFAGGLDRETVYEAVSGLIEALGTTDFSIDAERGLRYACSERHGDDIFEPKKAEEYFTRAVRAFSYR